MKKINIPFVAIIAIVVGLTQNNAFALNNNNNTKSQVETPQKDIQPTKYNFTLFSFFTNNEAPKVDTTRLKSIQTPNTPKRRE